VDGWMFASRGCIRGTVVRSGSGGAEYHKMEGSCGAGGGGWIIFFLYKVLREVCIGG